MKHLGNKAQELDERFGPFSSLRVRFALIMGQIAVFFVLATFAVVEIHANRSSHEELRRHLQELLIVHSASLVWPLWTLNESQVALYVDAIARDTAVATVLVTGDEGRIGAQVAKKPDSSIAYHDTVAITFETPEGSRQIGELTIGVTADPIAAERRNRISVVAPLAGLLLLSVILSSLYAFRRTVGLPLQRLLGGIERAHRYGEASVVDWPREDEMGRVVAAFNRMIAQRAEQERALVQTRDSLELRVVERTEELSNISHRLSDAIESLYDGFALFDDKKMLKTHNKKFVEIMKSKRNQNDTVATNNIFEGRYYDEFLDDILYEGPFDDRRLATTTPLTSEAADQSGARGPYLIRANSGRRYRVAERPTADGGLVCIYTDVTEFLSAIDAAEVANDAKSSFLAKMSHEIRTPINGIVGLLEILTFTNLDREQKQLAARIGESSQALLGVIDDILDISKIEAGHVTIERSTFSVQSVAESAADVVGSEAAQKGLDLAVIVGPEVPAMIACDKTQLRQVLINLLTNAVKFTEVGSVVMRVSRAGSTNDPRIHFAVSDTGIGIDPSEVERIFQPFEQGHSNIVDHMGGTGLGLAISNEIVQLLGGSISVTSVVGRGSTFAFEIPRGDVQTDVGQEDLDLKLDGVRIEIQSDSPAIVEMLDVLLKPLGAQVSHGLGCDRTGKAQNSEIQDLTIVDVPHVRSDPGLEPAANPRGALVLSTSQAMNPDNSVTGSNKIVPRPPQRRELLAAIGSLLNRPFPGDSTVGLPISDGSRAGQRADLCARTLRGRILVVDDNLTSLEVTKKQLSILGFAADTANDGLLGLQSWRRNAYSLVITDCRMPDMDGHEMTTTIRREEQARGRRAVPIIGLTANVLAGEADRCYRAGMDGYLSKPVRLADLERAIRHALGPRSTAGTGGVTPSNSSKSGHQSVRQHESPAGACPFDFAIFKEKFGSDAYATFCALLENAALELGEVQQMLNDAVLRRDFGVVADIAHRGIGIALALAAVKLSTALRAVENCALRGENQAIELLVREAGKEIQTVLDFELRSLELAVPFPLD